MRQSAASITRRRQVPWLRKHGYEVRLATCFLSVALATGLLRFAGAANLIWVVNGILLALVLLASRRRWPGYMASGFAAQIAASALAGPPWRLNLGLTALNLVEVLIAAHWIRSRSSAPPRFANRAYLVRFVSFGILAGPLALSQALAQRELYFLLQVPYLQLQVFVGSGVFLLYCIFVVLEQKRRIVRRFEKIAALHRLVSEHSRDAIILADLSGHRSYVSAAAESLGWNPEELLIHGGVEIVHPEDQQRAQAIVRGLNSGSEGAMIECRVRNLTGEYIWVEASLRLVRNPQTGIPSGILNVVRDVSERKKSEQKLQEAYSAVEALAVTDALTGLANRRRFDQYLAAEWRRSMRDRQPLSLLMLDVDKFKVYNDTYGHQRGDSCLKQIAEACMDVVSRPGDLVARFGGEEFVVILPNTENEGAMHVAEEICAALCSRKLPHKGNLAGIVTISAGCATLIPKFGKHAPDLIEMADQALYKAKQRGRNRVCNGKLIEERGGETQTSAVPEAAAGIPA